MKKVAWKLLGFVLGTSLFWYGCKNHPPTNLTITVRDITLSYYVPQGVMEDFWVLASKAADMPLSWKVMVATLSGKRFSSIWELEREFMNIGEAADLIERAALFPLWNSGVWKAISEQDVRLLFVERLERGDEKALALLRTIYSLYNSHFNQLGVGFELLKVITILNLRGKKLSKMLQNVDRYSKEFVVSSPITVESGDVLNFKAYATDPDGDTLIYTWSISSPSTLVSLRESSFSNTIGESVDWRIPESVTKPTDYTIAVMVSDGRGGVASTTVILTVNPPEK